MYFSPFPDRPHCRSACYPCACLGLVQHHHAYVLGSCLQATLLFPAKDTSAFKTSVASPCISVLPDHTLLSGMAMRSTSKSPRAVAREYLFRALPHPPPPTIGHTTAANNILCTYLGCKRNTIIPTFSGAVHQLLCHILRISTLTSRGKRCKRLPTYRATDAPVPLPSCIPVGPALNLEAPVPPTSRDPS